MATETITRLVDDLDGSKAERTVTFGWDGKDYSIDLSKRNIAAMEKALRPYLEAARSSTSRRGQRRSKRGDGNGSIDTRAVRDWARQNGLEVSDRGRISAEVRAAYEAVN